MAGNFFTRLARPRPRHISVFNGQDFKRAILAGHAWLEQHRAAVDALNVFPVPDGDTGKNMTLTYARGDEGHRRLDRDLGRRASPRRSRVAR